MTSPMLRFRIRSLAAACALALIVGRLTAADLIKDDFQYASSTDLLTNSNWQRIDYAPTANPSFVSLDSNTDSAVALNNRGLEQMFSSTPLTQDFDLRLNVAENNYSRSLYVLITSAPDVNGKVYGYGVIWNTALANNYSGQGYVAIQKIDGVALTSLSSVSTGGSNISGLITSGFTLLSTNTAPTLSSQFGEIRFTWDSAGSLSLYLGGSSVAAATVTDTTFSSFSNIYVSAGTTGYIDSLTLSTTAIPEPATGAVLVGVTALGFGAARRRRASRVNRSAL